MSDRLPLLLSQLLAVEESRIDESTTCDDIETWDSLRTLLLASMLESEYAMTLDIDEMDRLTSVASIRAIMASHGVA